MRLFSTRTYSLVHGCDKAIVLGVAGGRVPFEPEARWLYSLRLMLLLFKVEILWTTGERTLPRAMEQVGDEE